MFATTTDNVAGMMRTAVGVRLSDSGLAKIDLLLVDYPTANRSDVLRALLAEALATPAVVNEARKRLERAL